MSKDRIYSTYYCRTCDKPFVGKQGLKQCGFCGSNDIVEGKERRDKNGP